MATALAPLLAPAIRLGALVGRMALALVITRFLGVEDLALFGILQAVVVIGSRVLGCGAGVGVARMLPGLSPQHRRSLQSRQIRLFARNYGLLCLLAAIASLYLDGTQLYLLWWAVVLIVPNHLAGEVYHNLLFVGRPLIANFCVAAAGGLWAWLPLAALILVPEMRSLSLIFLSWLAGAMAGALVGLWGLELLWRPRGWQPPGKRNEIGLPAPHTLMRVYVVGLLQFVGIYGDRLVAGWMLDASSVGAFVLFWSVGYGCQMMVASLITGIFARRLAVSFASPDGSSYREQIRRGLLLTAVSALATMLPVAVAWQLLCRLLTGIDPTVPFSVTLVLFLGFVLRALADFAHLALSAAHRDRELMSAYVCSVPSSMILAGLLIWWAGAYGTFLAAALAASITAVALGIPLLATTPSGRYATSPHP